MTGVATSARVRHTPRIAALIMAAASAAMIVVGLPVGAQAQTAAAPASLPQPASSGVVARVNQIQTLRAQMRQMQGEIEVLQHQLQQMKQSGKAQYIDLDSRLGKLEQHHPTGATSSAPASSATPATSTSTAAPKSSTPASLSAADKAAAHEAYTAAFKAMRGSHYVTSAREFRAFIAKYPHSKLVSNAYYWLGESYYVTRNFKVALHQFQILLQKYPDSRKAPDAKLKVGYCQFEMKDYASAKQTLEAVAKAYPGTTVERLAKHRLQDIPSPSSGH